MSDIHSTTADNWETVAQLHRIVEEVHIRHQQAPDLSSGNLSSFWLKMEEQRMINVLILWSVITLESMTNHALAEVIKHDISAINAIEHPNKVLNGWNEKERLSSETARQPKIRSELAKKLLILADREDMGYEALTCADKISSTRNNIAHTKPFRYEIADCGGVDAAPPLQKRGSAQSIKYDDLIEFYEHCDRVREYIYSRTQEMDYVPTFSSLLETNPPTPTAS